MSRIFTQEMIEVMRVEYPRITAVWLAELLNERFGTSLSGRQVASACKRYGIKSGRKGYFPKGQVPHNKGKEHRHGEKGWFKKGHNPANSRDVGEMRWCSKDHMWLVKTPDGAWKSYQSVLYDKPVPPGHVVIVLDYSKPITLDNIKCIPRSQLVRLNKMKYSTSPPELKPSLLLLTELLDKLNRS